MIDRSPHTYEALARFGLTDDQAARFLDHGEVVYPLPTQTEPRTGLIHLVDDATLRSGIIEISDEGNGLRTFARFRGRTFALARDLGLAEVELFGAAIINPKVEGWLDRQNFIRRVEAIPDDLGDDGTMQVLFKVYAVP